MAERFSDLIARQHTQRPPGQLSARYLSAMASGKSWSDREKFAMSQRQWGDDDRKRVVELLTKASVDAIGLADTTGMYGPLSVDFLQFLRQSTIYARLPGVRRAPLRTRIISGSTGATASFIAPATAKPATAMAFAAASELAPKKVVGMAVITLELSELSAPDGEDLILGELARACAEAIDEGMFDPSLGVSTARPASLSHAASASFTSSGTTAAAIAADLRLLITAVGNSGSDLTNAAWIMRPSTAAYLATLIAGPVAFATLTLGSAGSFLGLPVFVTANAQNVGSPGENFIVLVDGSQVLLGEGGIDLSASREGSVQLLDNPSSSAATQTSLWQNNLVGLKAEIFIDWRLRAPGAIAVLGDVAF